jgi:hypothetical protein
MIRELAKHFGIPLLPVGQKADTRVFLFKPDSKEVVTQELAKRGYTVKTFGTETADVVKPDFKREGYHNGTLWIYDPTGGNGALTWDAEYTWVWRATHEYAHAETMAMVDAHYGAGRRAGSLGNPLTLKECQRALYWEFLTFGVQWAFLTHNNLVPANTMGDYCRESAVNLLDALVRCVTGGFSDPATEGVNIKGWYSYESPASMHRACQSILLGYALAKGITCEQ